MAIGRRNRGSIAASSVPEQLLAGATSENASARARWSIVIVLGIETSPRRGSVALLRRGSPCVLHELSPDVATGGAGRALAPAIDALLKSESLRVHGLDLIAVGLGPGGYTGTRLAVATARTLALVSGKPVIGVVSTAALAAHPSIRDGLVCAVIDAKNDDVYVAEYERRGELVVELRAPAVSSARDVVTWIGSEHAIVGDGAPRVLAHLVHPDHVTPVAHVMPSAAAIVDASIAARASEVARLGEIRFERGERDDESLLLPLYLRVSEAERRFRERQARQSST